MSSIGGMKGSTTIGACNISKAADFQLAATWRRNLGRIMSVLIVSRQALLKQILLEPLGRPESA